MSVDKAGFRRFALVGAGILFVLALFFAYRFYDPSENSLFPRCPFRLLTGWECPGCGSQRAVHSLLNGRVAEAFRHNPLAVVFIPYLLAGAMIGRVGNPSRGMLVWRRRLYGEFAIYGILGVILLFTVWRNL